MNEGFGKDFCRKGNSVKRSEPFSEPLKTDKLPFSSSRKAAPISRASDSRDGKRHMNTNHLALRTLRPLTAFQKCPEPQICQKFVPTIVFGGSNQGGPNLSKICRKIGKFVHKFLTNLGPPDWNPQKQSPGQIFDKFGVSGHFWNAVRGWRVRKPCSGEVLVS